MKKGIALFLSLILTSCAAGCGNSSEKPNPGPTPGVKTEKKVVDLAGQTALSETVTKSNQYANGVQAYYVDNDRTTYVVSNRNTDLYHELSGKKFVSSFRNKQGEEYLYNTMDSYVVYGDEYYYGSDGPTDARINTTKLGYYYYSTYVRDMGFDDAVPLHLEKAYHTYSDRTQQQYRIIADDKTNYLTEFGYEIKVKKSRVSGIELRDGDEIVTELKEGTYTFDNLGYIGLNIAKAGIVGIITVGQGTKVSVSVNAKNYVIRQYLPLNGISAMGEETFANRLYTDETHSFAGLRKAYTEETELLTEDNISVEAKDGARFVGYNRLTGAYEFVIDGQGFNESYYKQPQKKYFESVKVSGANDDRIAYLSVKTVFPLEGAAIADKNGNLLPVPLQVGKNFGHEKEEPIYNPSDAKYGETILPLCIKSGEEYEFTVVNAYQKWGNYDLKQLSSIEYFISYYHLSTGVTETNCIAPYYSAGAKGGFGVAWVLPDFRGCSGNFWADDEKQTGDPQYNSVGTLCAPTDNYGLSMGNYNGSDIAYSGLTYADLTYSYTSADGSYEYSMRHVEMPQKDESRTYYTIEFTFLEDTFVDNEAFSIIGFDGRKGTYKNSAYLDENGNHTELINPTKKGNIEIYKLNKEGSYFTYYGLPSALKDETGNFGCIVKDYSITVGGKETDVGLAFLNDFRSNPTFGDLNYGSLTLDESVSFKKGDKISVDVILLPYGLVGQETCENVIKVYNDSVKNALTVTAAVGTVTADTWIPTVAAQNGVAEFTLTGGTYGNSAEVNYAVKVQGYDTLTRPKIYEKVNGEWVPYNYATELGYDGYGVLCENEKLTYTFVFTQNAAGRTFRVVTE